jgi:excisionase family DNA binding protein
MTVAEAARILEVTTGVVYDLCAKRLIGHHRVGAGRGQIRLAQADIDEYVARRRVEPVDVTPRGRAADPPPAVRSIIGELRARREERKARGAPRT